MKCRLRDIVNIQTGYFAKPETNATVLYFQSRHFDELGKLVTTLIPELKFSAALQRHLLKEGDVLYAAKGPKNFATQINKLQSPSVASTTFFVLRIQSIKILPAYLCWYLNKPEVKDELRAKAKGTAMQSISKTTLEELLIEIPSLENQNLVLKINSLIELETNIRQEITRLYSYYSQQVLNEAIKRK